MVFYLSSMLGTRDRVREMYVAGFPVREIASELGCSTQNVYLHLTKLRQTGEVEGPARGREGQEMSSRGRDD